MTTHDGGKGDKQIPPKDLEQFEKNWDAIFNQPKPESIEFNIEADNDHAAILATIPFGK
jgi:hypothetical protein